MPYISGGTSLNKISGLPCLLAFTWVQPMGSSRKRSRGIEEREAEAFFSLFPPLPSVSVPLLKVMVLVRCPPPHSTALSVTAPSPLPLQAQSTTLNTIGFPYAAHMIKSSSDYPSFSKPFVSCWKAQDIKYIKMKLIGLA